MPSTLLSAPVVIVTYERPDFLARCLDCIRVQTVAPLEVIVVDSSSDDATRDLVRERYPEVHYAICPLGYGATATARAVGVRLARAEIVAFLDDDAYADPDWLAQLLSCYDNPEVGAVGGRASRGYPREEELGLDEIGKLRPDGTLTGNFAAHPGRAVEVDHLLGANLSIRASVLEELGGPRDGYGGTCLREETDLCLRVGALGYRLLYTPFAHVEHVAAPYPRGQRFDLRYHYWGQHNHLVMLLSNFGPTSPELRRYLVASVSQQRPELSERLQRARGRLVEGDIAGAARRGAARSLAGAVARSSVLAAATPIGLVRGLRLAAADRREQKRKEVSTR